MTLFYKDIKVMALSKPQWRYDLDEFKHKPADSVKVHVHTVNVGDVEDPDLILGAIIYDWQHTEKGKWIMEHSSPSPSYHRNIDHLSYGYIYYICAYLHEKDYTFYRLKFS